MKYFLTEVLMWYCKHCKEQNEDNFDICWKCGYGVDGESPNQLVREIKEIKNNKNKQEVQYKPKDKFYISGLDYLDYNTEKWFRFDRTKGFETTKNYWLKSKIIHYKWLDIKKIEYKNFYYTKKRTILNFVHKMLIIYTKDKTYYLVINYNKFEEKQMITNLNALNSYTNIYIQENMEEEKLEFWRQNKRGSIKRVLLYISFFVFLFFAQFIVNITRPTIDELRVILQKNKIDNEQIINMIHSSRFGKECGFFYSNNSFISLKLEDKTKVRILKYCGTVYNKWYLKSDEIMTRKQAIEQEYIWSDK